ncbi:MAG: malto-oligosyltrehalose trehalohydrolase [Vicinamibacterales bacterium]
MASWVPTLGACCESGGTRFRVWAPSVTTVDLVIERPRAAASTRRLRALGDGSFEATCDDVSAGTRYRYLLDGRGPFPDPASRYQPDGVHGPSLVVDPRPFRWSDQQWEGRALGDVILYELHVGTFTHAGTFASLEAKLPVLADLGVTAIELMPVADWPGRRNWGYDGAALFAPARRYGTPDELRRVVDRAHALGLAVILDVVYNHLGPDGAYWPAFVPAFFSTDHASPWGAGLNFDGPGSPIVREVFIENALHWLSEYHVDGLRLDATHAIVDGSDPPFLAELARRVRASLPGRRVLLIAEDGRNLAALVRPTPDAVYGFDAVWADDFHHQMRRQLAGDRDGYFQDFTGSTADLALTLSRGWFFCGQWSDYHSGPRGTAPDGVPLERFVVCLQNHDQVGNRAFGERLHHQIDLAAYRAASAVLLCMPETPLLFMGQEWGATSPFLYFTDHRGDLGERVTHGRRLEFGRFAAFADEEVRARIPDPQATDTFVRSRLVWRERRRRPHASLLRLYRALIHLRRTEPALHAAPGGRTEVVAPTDDAIAIHRRAAHGREIVLVAQLCSAGVIDLRRLGSIATDDGGPWTVLLTTEEPAFASDPRTPRVISEAGRVLVECFRPSAVILARDPAAFVAREEPH